MYWVHLNESEPIARKDHICDLCGLKIHKGEKHVSRSGVGDNGIVRMHMHPRCEAITKDWKDDDWLYHDEWEFRQELQTKHSLGFYLSGTVDYQTSERKIDAVWLAPYKEPMTIK